MADLSRRRLIQTGLGGAVLLAFGGGVLAWASAGYRLLDGEAAVGLSPKQLCVARSVVDAMLPGGDGLPSGVELGIHQRIDEQVWAAEESLRSDLRAVLELVEHAPPLYGKLGRFTSLGQATRRELLEKMMRSSLDVMAQAAAALRQLCHVLYYADDRSWEPIGYDGPWVKEPKPPESAQRYARLREARKKAT